MIQQDTQEVQHPLWQKLLASGVASSDELLTLLGLEKTLANQVAQQQFALRVPRGFVARMLPGDLHDPLLRQVLPVNDELVQHPLYSLDPLHEEQFNPIPGVLHKYHGRVLLTLTGACAINCRYCFRRHFPYEANNPGRPGWQAILDYLANDSSITEVILSGGDPLLLNDQQLATRIRQLAGIPHLQRLRIHSRMPIVLPERVTQNLIATLKNTRLQTVIVVHCNHANEIDASVAKSCQRLAQAGFTLLNQAVLLQGINDGVAQLLDLNHALFRINVLPYYLHLPDKVQGTQHFAVDVAKAQQLMRAISRQLPGYLVPKLVYEQSGEESKKLITY